MVIANDYRDETKDGKHMQTRLQWSCALRFALRRKFSGETRPVEPADAIGKGEARVFNTSDDGAVKYTQNGP